MQSSGGHFRGEKESTSIEGKMGLRECTPVYTASRNVRENRSCGRDAYGLVLGAAGAVACNRIDADYESEDGCTSDGDRAIKKKTMPTATGISCMALVYGAQR